MELTSVVLGLIPTIVALVDRYWSRIIKRIPRLNRSRAAPSPRPYQTEYARLLQDDRAYQGEMRRSSHYVIGWYPPTPACGWNGGWWDGISLPGSGLYGTRDKAALLQMKREQDALETVGGQYSGRKPCGRCLTALGST